MRSTRVLLCAVCFLLAAASAALAQDTPVSALSSEPVPRDRRAQTVGELRRKRRKAGRRKAGLDPVAAGKALLALAARPDADLTAWRGWRGSLARSARRALGWPQDTDELLVYMSHPPEYHQRKAAEERASSLSDHTESTSSSDSLPALPPAPRPDFEDAPPLHQDL